MSVALTKNNNLQMLGALVALAEAERSFRDVQGFIERTLAAAAKYWLVVPAVAAGYAYMVSDEERFEVLETLANHVLDVVPLDAGLERALGIGA